MFKVNEFDRFFKIYLPYISLGLIPNSLASWANGWFFLIATEIITVGHETYTINGIGSYIMQSAIKGDIWGILTGITLVSLLIILMDIFIWRPLMNMSSKYIKGKKESMIYDRILDFRPDANINMGKSMKGVSSFIDRYVLESLAKLLRSNAFGRSFDIIKIMIKYAIMISIVALLIALLDIIYGMLPLVTIGDILMVMKAFVYSFGRIIIAYLLCIIWIIPAVYLISRSTKYEPNVIRWMEIIGSIPVSAIFPAAIIILMSFFGNFEIVAIIFLMTGMQWYLFFNIYGAYKSLPEYINDLKNMYGIKRQDYIRRIVMPFMMPFIIIGSLAAIGGGWNAAIVAEYVSFGDNTFEVYGIGSLIHNALIQGDVKMMFLCAMCVATAIPFLNLCFWRPIMKRASKKRGSLV
jgi:NitT/TauT family transport system permease protein